MDKDIKRKTELGKILGSNSYRNITISMPKNTLEK